MFQEELSSPVSSAKRDEEPPAGSSANREALDFWVEDTAEGSSGDVPNSDIGSPGVGRVRGGVWMGGVGGVEVMAAMTNELDDRAELDRRWLVQYAIPSTWSKLFLIS
jgi:hypothetical protein